MWSKVSLFIQSKKYRCENKCNNELNPTAIILYLFNKLKLQIKHFDKELEQHYKGE